jgi:hypothetical protein
VFKKGIQRPLATPAAPVSADGLPKAGLNHQIERVQELGGDESKPGFAFVKVIYPANATKAQREAAEKAAVAAYEKEHGPIGDAFGFQMILREEPEPERPLHEPVTYAEKVELAAQDWESFKRLPGPPPQPPGGTTCDQPAEERRVDEFRMRLNYGDFGRADLSPEIVFNAGVPKKDELKAYAEKIAGQRTFHRPHERLRTPSVERMIKEDHGG